MLNNLKKRLKGKIVIVGIGNNLRGDDGAGPELIQRLKSQIPKDEGKVASKSQIVLIDAGEVPENYLEKIINYNADTILLVDAVNFQDPPGSIKFIESNQLKERNFSTHSVSLFLVTDYLKNRTKADILILGIQPESIDLNNGLSEPMKEALKKIEDSILECMSKA